MKQLIINADDLGMCPGTNRAIRVAHEQGLVTSASLMANMAACADAVEHVVRACPRLGVGIHLALTCGRPVLPARDVALLVDRQGAFCHGFLSLWRALRRDGAALRRQIAAELRAQCERLAALGVALDHANGHQHVHMLPGVWEIVIELAREFCSGLVRVSREPWRLAARGVPGLFSACRRGNFAKQWLLARLAQSRPSPTPAAALIGVLDSGSFTTASLCRQIEHLGEGVTELLIHPSYGAGAIHDPAGNLAALADLSPADRRFTLDPSRQRELAALCSAEARAAVARSGVELMRFADLRAPRPTLVEVA